MDGITSKRGANGQGMPDMPKVEIPGLPSWHTHTHTHTHVIIWPEMPKGEIWGSQAACVGTSHIYFMCVCVCVCFCVGVGVDVCVCVCVYYNMASNAKAEGGDPWSTKLAGRVSHIYIHIRTKQHNALPYDRPIGHSGLLSRLFRRTPLPHLLDS